MAGSILTYAASALYQAIGDTFVRSTMVANAGKTQLRFTLTARKADFDALQHAFRSSLISWQWTEPKAVTESPSN